MKWGNRYEFACGVYFDESVRPDKKLDLLNQEPYHCEIYKWCVANCKSGYMRFFLASSYVLFADIEEGMLCRMAFSGGKTRP